jgi:hypothetical protein
MIAQPDVQPRYTPTEYLDQEVAAELRHEYIDVEIFSIDSWWVIHPDCHALSQNR